MPRGMDGSCISRNSPVSGAIVVGEGMSGIDELHALRLEIERAKAAGDKAGLVHLLSQVFIQPHRDLVQRPHTAEFVPEDPAQLHRPNGCLHGLTRHVRGAEAQRPTSFVEPEIVEIISTDVVCGRTGASDFKGIVTNRRP